MNISKQSRRVTVEVVRPPDSAAPEWVRDAWVGLRVPAETSAPAAWTTGSRSGTHAVRAADVIAGLHEHGRHSAAEWLAEASLLRVAGVRTFVLCGDDVRIVPNPQSPVRRAVARKPVAKLPF